MESIAPALTDNQAQSRFEIRVGGELGGFIDYHRRGRKLITLVHTEVDDRFQGQGLAGKLTRFALDTARADGTGVIPSCPYIQNWITKHPDYAALVPENRRPEFGL